MQTLGTHMKHSTSTKHPRLIRPDKWESNIICHWISRRVTPASWSLDRLRNFEWRKSLFGSWGERAPLQDSSLQVNPRDNLHLYEIYNKRKLLLSFYASICVALPAYYYLDMPRERKLSNLKHSLASKSQAESRVATRRIRKP